MTGWTENPPKSILKKPLAPAEPFVTSETPTPAPRPAGPATAPPQSSRNYQLALQHANIIQARKDIEALILDSTEEFLSFPKTPHASASSPSKEDLKRFQTIIQPFQISDYDEIFEERNLVDKCGYIFCPNKPLREPHRGPLRLALGAAKGEGMRILTAKQAEMWCSAQCARRALFIKVQLGETPAWERLGGKTRPVQVLDEGGQNELEDRMHRLRLTGAEGDELEQAMGQLALERGEDPSSISGAQRKDAVVLGQLVENDLSGKAVAPSVGNAASDGAIDGYTPRTAAKKDSRNG